MSEVEETLERIKAQKGVEGFVICQLDGTVLRRHEVTQETAERYAERVIKLAQNARNYVRDINPRDKLRNLRVRANEKELLVAYEQDFIILVIQKWEPALGV
uniref:Roadblock/LAMTOR2 domain-containing protein n=1 Tax=Leptocylindrus danicus TaxID=163516 RepID=A0A7S2LPZ7_9STRA|mmetsp:Transcript_8284/g.12324  ORF Transcript_8284/g.12324 Transcript_8284/m.12324 type:complete len:102 (+) Transcript_8284:50-355(+)|eukprot:CAMPEP_0116018092 /NCGR_PEP_ID=MMETSP0321-20121206/8439_1 /TAXON_ID=163516 /ORGANISM="Leptocylindrus danicus var. danicus, Strain B650" /LENGTH=101 /DNA_ID=CAMNT_0003488413 /DNA_START=49 /DNA_END=354 /DNA_ORIENTATION=-